MAARKFDPVVMTSPCNPGIPNCCPHPWSGMIKEGSGNTTFNSIPVARKMDKGQCFCPHAGTFQITSSSSDTSNGQKIARVNDEVTCMTCGAKGKIISGSPNVFVNKF
ncbi:MAG: PAAR domain-containing protein [Myxococcota bacterium]